MEIGAFGPGLSRDAFDFVFNSLLISRLNTQLSPHFTLLVCTPYIDGAASIFSDIDAYCKYNNLTCFVILLTDQGGYTGISPAITAIKGAGYYNLFGVIFDANTIEKKLYVHSKIYAAYQYHPNKNTIFKKCAEGRGRLKESVAKLVLKGTQMDNISAMFEPIMVAFGSANLTHDAIKTCDQHEIIVKTSDNSTVDFFRSIFGHYIHNLPITYREHTF